MSLSELAATFANNLLPIMLVGGAGFLLGRFLTIDPRSLGRTVFYVFSPLLVFDMMVKSQLDLRDSLITVAFTTAVILAMGLLTLGAGMLFKLERPQLLAVLLTVAFGNTGNYGLPLAKFAFGNDALAVASIFYVTTTILFNTLGVIIASLGHTDLKSAAAGVLRLPIVYGVGLAILVRAFNIALPLPVTRTVEIAANGAIPVMLILLGLELGRIEWSNSWKPISLGVGLRLLAGPLMALILAGLFGLKGPARQASVQQASMPAAVVTTVVAGEYQLEPSLVTAIVFLGTALSPLTLTPLLVYLGR